MGHGTLWGYVPCFHCLCRIHSDSTLPSRARKKTTIKRDCARFAGLFGVRHLFPVLERWVSGPECCWRGFGRGRLSRGGREVRPRSRVPIWGFFSCERGGRGDAQGDPREGYFFLPPFGRLLLPGFFMGEIFVALVFVVCNGLLPAEKSLGVLCSMKAGLLSFSRA
jgi:hypothetical protein